MLEINKLPSFVIALVLLLGFFSIYGCANVGDKNYFVRLGDIGEARVASKYGQGEYYFHRSNYRFSGLDDIKEKEKYFSFVEGEVIKQKICSSNFMIFRGTLSFYSESGSVSILVKCELKGAQSMGSESLIFSLKD